MCFPTIGPDRSSAAAAAAKDPRSTAFTKTDMLVRRSIRNSWFLLFYLNCHLSRNRGKAYPIANPNLGMSHGKNRSVLREGHPRGPADRGGGRAAAGTGRSAGRHQGDRDQPGRID